MEKWLRSTGVQNSGARSQEPGARSQVSGEGGESSAGLTGRRSRFLALLMGVILVSGATGGWTSLIPSARAKPPAAPDAPITGWGDGTVTLGGESVLIGGNSGLSGQHPIAVPDLDRDGVPETGLAWSEGDHYKLGIWLSSRGEPEGRFQDIAVAERFVNQTAVFTNIGAFEDIDGDGVLEITTLGSALHQTTAADVPTLTIYSSTTGQPAFSLYGSNANIFQAVMTGRAVGEPVDDLLWEIGEFDFAAEGFILTGLVSDQAGAFGTMGVAVIALPPPSEIGRITWELRHWNPVVWSYRIGRFINITHTASTAAKNAYTNAADDGKKNALRHALWMLLLMCEFDEETTENIGDIHESTSTDPCDSAIDQYNNAVARAMVGNPCIFILHLAISADATGVDIMVETLKRLIDSGEFIIDRNDPRMGPPCP